MVEVVCADEGENRGEMRLIMVCLHTSSSVLVDCTVR